MDDEVYLNISKTLSHSRANGPGVRAVIWVQGCTIGCEGCYSIATHPHKKVNIVPPSELAEWICSLQEITGVTLSGGEPFEQADAVHKLLEEIQSRRPELTTFVFTGFEVELLRQSTDSNVQALLEQIDMLCCGPFLAEHYDMELLWRGSTNQRLIYLSDRYSPNQEVEWAGDSPVEEVLFGDMSMEYTGFKGSAGMIYNHLRTMDLVE